jgi:GT2 family glycosyltransferase
VPQAQSPYDFEILVKSFLRYGRLLRLVRSVRRHYPHVTIRIADDSPDSDARNAAFRTLEAMGDCVVYRLPTNGGIPVARNRLVREVRTPYFVLTDDDKVFTRRTRLGRLRRVLDADPACAIAAGMNVDYGVLLRYQHGRIEQDGRHVRRCLFGARAPTVTVGGVTCVPCGLTPNFFMASRELFHRHGIEWDERFRVGHGEHLWFFCRLPAGLHVYVVPGVRVSHFPTRWGEREYRRIRYDQAEIRKLEDVAGIEVETIWVHEGFMQRHQRRLLSGLRRALDRAVSNR